MNTSVKYYGLVVGL